MYQGTHPNLRLYPELELFTEKPKMKYLIGTDPELFLENVEGKFVSAHDIIPGSKLNPHRVDGGFIQPDGTAAEFNTDPVDNADDFSAGIINVLTQLQEVVSKHGLSLVATPTATFEMKYFKTLPGVAKAFGCTPDYNAWTNKRTHFKPTKEPFRTGAGHIHIGWTQDVLDVFEGAHMFDCLEAVKQLDSCLYPASLIWDKDTKRRTLYGKMGSFRPKPYGVEYRPLSNAWIADPDLHRFVFDTAIHAMHLIDQNELIHKDYAIRLNLEALEAEEELEDYELLDLHDFLVREYGFPKLPESYLEAA